MINCGCYEKTDGKYELNKKVLTSHLHHLDFYAPVFSELYNIPLDDVKHAIGYINRLTPTEIYEKISPTLLRLKHIIKREDLTC